MPTVMIAEDDLIMADMLEDVLTAEGYQVCGIARTVDKAVELCERHRPELAVLDIRLAEGGLGTDIPVRLKSHNRMGILYASGHVGQMDLTHADGDAVISKPYRPDDVVRALKIVEQIVSIGEAARPLPRGFSILNGSSRNDKVPDLENAKSNEIRKLRRQQAALADFGSFALGERDLGTVLVEAARICAECLEVPFAKVCRFRPEENDLLVEAGVGWHQGVIGRVVSRADESSPQGRAFSTGEPVICSNLGKDASFVLPPFYADHGIISTVDVIIKKEGRPYGVLEIDSTVQQDYDQHDINFLTGFANVLAEAVNTSKRNLAMQNAVDRMHDMVVDKDRMLATKTELLDEKAILAHELQHRVRNNLQLVYGMLNRHLETTSDTVGIEGISAIARRVMTLAQVYEHLLGTGLSRTIDFGRYLAALCSSFQDIESAQHPGIELTCRVEPVVLDLDTVTALGLVTSELIANSYAHAFPGNTGLIRVELSPSRPGGDAMITFTDDGVGFTEKIQNKRHGLGLVRRLMEQVNGSATLCSGQGTRWTLTFPTALHQPMHLPAQATAAVGSQ